MTKFSGIVGFAEQQVETEPGIFENQIVERRMRGDINSIRNSVEIENKVVEDISLNAVVSVLADQFSYSNFQSIRYVKYMNSYWKVTSVEVARPRLLLTIGGLYTSETP